MRPGPKIKDLSGQRFGRWTVLKRSGRVKSLNRAVIWECVCDCGRKGKVQGGQLRSGHSKSCGCYGIEVRKKINSLPPDRAILNRMWASYRSTAKRFNRSFKLSKKQFERLTKQNCFYCGAPPAAYVPVLQKHCRTPCFAFCNGIDRIDNSKGYLPNNVVPCCTQCNIMKNHFSISDFLQHVKAIAIRQQILNWRVA